MKERIRAAALAAALASALVAPQGVSADEASYERFKVRVAAAEDAAGVPRSDVDAAVTDPQRGVLRRDVAASEKTFAPSREETPVDTEPAAGNPDKKSGRDEIVFTDSKGRTTVLEAPVPDEIKKSGMPGIKKIVDIDVDVLRAVGTEDGSVLFIADMGHYVFKGQMLDVWQRKVLRTIDEIAESVNRVDLKGMGYFQNDYAKYVAGTGEKTAVLFVDPRCGWCHKMLDEVLGDEKLLSEYRFSVHVIPVLGEESARLAKKLWRSEGTDAEKLAALVAGPEAIDALSDKKASDPGPQDRAMILAGLLSIKAVPFAIAPDGRTSEGKPSDMRMFLENDVNGAKKMAEATKTARMKAGEKVNENAADKEKGEKARTVEE